MTKKGLEGNGFIHLQAAGLVQFSTRQPIRGHVAFSIESSLPD